MPPAIRRLTTSPQIAQAKNGAQNRKLKSNSPTRVRLHAAMEVLFPGSATAARKFETQVTELEPERPRELGPVTVTPYPAQHFAGDPAYHLRVEVAGRTVTYSGDTGWSEALIPASRDADLLISECFFYDKEIEFHMNYRRFMANRARLGARRIVLTHLGEEMMARHADLQGEFAEASPLDHFVTCQALAERISAY